MFYLQYAARNFWRNRRWSLFRCVFDCCRGRDHRGLAQPGAGNWRLAHQQSARNQSWRHHDYRWYSPPALPSSLAAEAGDDSGFSDSEIEALTNWVEARGGDITVYFTTSGVQIAKPGSVTAGRPQFVTSIFVDPMPLIRPRTRSPRLIRLVNRCQNLFDGDILSGHQQESGGHAGDCCG